MTENLKKKILKSKWAVSSSPKKEGGSWSERAKILSWVFGRGEMGRSFHMSALRNIKVTMEKRFCYWWILSTLEGEILGRWIVSWYCSPVSASFLKTRWFQTCRQRLQPVNLSKGDLKIGRWNKTCFIIRFFCQFFRFNYLVHNFLYKKKPGKFQEKSKKYILLKTKCSC